MSRCKLPDLSWPAFEIPAFALRLPKLPVLAFAISISCPLDG